jgi:Invasin, domain 3/Domain of unknown function (DUF4214)
VGTYLQQAVGDNLSLGTSSLANGLGSFLQEATGANISLDTSSLGQGLGAFLEQAVGANLDLATSSLAEGLGGFLQQGAQDGLSFLQSSLDTGAGNFLEQAVQEGADFLNSDVAGDVGTFLQQAAQAGSAFASSTLGGDIGTFLNEEAQAGTDFLNAAYFGDASSFLDQVFAGGLTGSSLSQDALSYIDQTIPNGAVSSNFAQYALPFLQQAATAGFSGSGFAQDVGSLISQLETAGLSDAEDQLPGVAVANAALLTSLGNACISQGFVSQGLSALELAATLSDQPGPYSLAQSLVLVSPSSIPSGGAATVTLYARDTNGNLETSGGLTVAFTPGNNAIGTVGSVTDNGNGTYTATFTGTEVGSTAITATIDGNAVTSTLPIITVTASQPSATTGAATAITSTTVTLNATVDPRGSATTMSFVYGTTANLNSGTAATAGQSLGDGTSVVSESAVVTGLTSGTTYYYRVVATSTGGTTDGSILSFTTTASVSPPVATTETATAVTSATATLNASADSEGSATTVSFAYGTSPTLSSGTTTTVGQAIGNGTAPVSVSAVLSGLAPSTTYYYEVIATSAAGTTDGTILSFATTASVTPPAATETISGEVYLDVGGTGVLAAGDPGIANRTVFVDLNGDDNLDPGDPSAVTNASGGYTLTGVPATGTVTVRLLALPGDNPTLPYSESLSLTPAPGSTVAGGNFGLQPVSTVLPIPASTPEPFGIDNLNVDTALVNGLYTLILGRPADLGGVSYFVEELQSGTSMLQVAASFYNSTERDTKLVQSFYETYLGRVGESSGVSFYVAQLQAGMTEQAVTAEFLDSPEYSADHSSNASFIQSLYENILGRNGASSEVSAWVSLMSATVGPVSRSTAVTDFINSTESDSRMIQSLYVDILDRQGSASEVSAWVTIIQTGQLTLDQVAERFFDSPEFATRAQATVV